MFRHVPVAPDLSEASTAMLSCLESLRLLGTEEATLIHVLPVCDAGGLALRLRELECEDLPSRLLFPTDFSDTAERAVAFVEHIVQPARSPVTLLHVQARSHIEPHLLHGLGEFNATDRARLERLASRLEALGAKRVDIEIPCAFPAPTIVERGREHSLVVMGSQGRGFARGEFLGSVTQKVLRRTPTALLVVPPIR